MNVLKALICGAIVAVPTAAMAANNPCTDMKWHAKFLDLYPKAAVACQDVQVKDGVKYAKFIGKVIKVTKTDIEVETLNVAGTPISKGKWLKDPNETMMVDGKEVKANKLKKGDELTFWVAENQFTYAPSPGAPVHQFKRE
jgi:hypothetical protein